MQHVLDAAQSTSLRANGLDKAPGDDINAPLLLDRKSPSRQERVRKRLVLLGIGTEKSGIIVSEWAIAGCSVLPVSP
jgi:hypothetical protein